MRGILFRAKNFDNGVWVQGYYVRLNGNKHFIYTGQSDVDCGNYYPDYYPVAAKTVGQFTGLTDKNGTKIFEGDIIKRKWNGGLSFYKVVFYDDIGAFVGETEKGGFCTFDYDADYFEIIGNIHDNPELLKGRC